MNANIMEPLKKYKLTWKTEMDMFGFYIKMCLQHNLVLKLIVIDNLEKEQLSVFMFLNLHSMMGSVNEFIKNKNFDWNNSFTFIYIILCYNFIVWRL
jgi:hypothetical protein